MKTLVIYKHSKYEWEMKKLGLTHYEICAKYEKEKANLAAILNSHEIQLWTRMWVKATLSEASHYMLDELDQLEADGSLHQYQLVIAVGGDNSFTCVSGYLKPHQILAGLNSDPERSVGALTRWSANNIAQDLNDLNLGNFNIENWTTLRAGEKSAISEIFIGSASRFKMSRHVISYRGTEEEQKSSGLIISTGAGSTGWYNAVNWMNTDYSNRFHPTSEYAKFVLTEPYNHNVIGGTKTIRGDIMPDDKLVIHSLNGDDGVISFDSWWSRKFNRGDSIEICLGTPRKVAIPNEALDCKHTIG